MALFAALAHPPTAASVSVAWERLDAPDGVRTPLRAVALDPNSDALALADAGGVALRSQAGTWRRVRVEGEPRDLAFDPEGGIWIATARGLWLWRHGTLADESPAPGERVRAALRVAAWASGVAVATENGVYLRSPEGGWRPLRGAFAQSHVAALALASRSAAPELWAASESRLFHLDPARTGPSRDWVEFPLPAAARPVVDLALSQSGAEVALLDPTELWVRRAGERWRRVELPRPSGASALRVVRGAGSWWILTERGVLRSELLLGPWRPEPIAGQQSRFRDAAGAGERIALLSERTLWLGRLAPSRTRPRVSPPVSRSACTLRAIEVQRAVLAYLGLERSRLERLRQGAARRAWLPELTLRAERTRRRLLSGGSDESFTYGSLHHLHDDSLERSLQHEFSLTLSWDLGGLLYHPEEVDAAAEVRRLIELRDDILDEVNRLFFERERLLRRMAGGRAGSAAVREERMRIRELAAGLDAWTGGWFTQRVAREPACQGQAHVAAPHTRRTRAD